MKAALEAWSAGSNLFHQGINNERDDPEVVSSTMADFPDADPVTLLFASWLVIGGHLERLPVSETRLQTKASSSRRPSSEAGRSGPGNAATR
ncbi:hypothetical protein [Bradyrhizobium sp. CCGUVB23]|uniref:hypothetical protein n=1 Tax=Bradyrhizobium sp. CCGUVB23 TaxID=2949630 RepID=UPI003532760D